MPTGSVKILGLEVDVRREDAARTRATPLGTLRRHFEEGAAILTHPAAAQGDEALGLHDRGTVLFVDDQSTQLQIIGRTLETAGYTVHTAQQAETSLQTAATHSIDVAICDLHMPIVDGISLMRRLQAHDPNLPVIILSADADVSGILDAVGAGAFDYVLKTPEGLRLLPVALDRAVNHSRAAHRAQLLTKELERANAELEARVSRRTAALEATVDQLRRRRQELQTALDELEAAKQHIIMQERLASMGTLSAGIAHEINNPAAVVMANLELARADLETLDEAASEVRRWVAAHPELEELQAVFQQSELSPRLSRLRDVVADGLEGIRRIATLSADLRVFSRHQNDEQEPVDINATVATACRMAGNEIRHRATLHADYQPLPQILGNRLKLSQVVLNLLINAAHAIPEGNTQQHRVSVRTSIAGELLCIEVADTGRGIPPEIAQRIFEPFFTTKPVGEGTGLGLALCAKIVRDHGGELTFTSTPGEGSRFLVEIPIGTSAVAPASRTPISTLPPPPLVGLRILLVDDEELLLKALRRTLAGNEVVLAQGGTVAQRTLAADSRFDLVLCDLRMADVDGSCLYESVAATDADLASRFIFLTGGAFAEHATEFLDRVGVCVLKKPTSRTELVEACQTTLMRVGRRPVGSNHNEVHS